MAEVFATAPYLEVTLAEAAGSLGHRRDRMAASSIILRHLPRGRVPRVHERHFAPSPRRRLCPGVADNVMPRARIERIIGSAPWSSSTASILSLGTGERTDRGVWIANTRNGRKRERGMPSGPYDQSASALKRAAGTTSPPRRAHPPRGDAARPARFVVPTAGFICGWGLGPVASTLRRAF